MAKVKNLPRTMSHLRNADVVHERPNLILRMLANMPIDDIMDGLKNHDGSQENWKVSDLGRILERICYTVGTVPWHFRHYQRDGIEIDRAGDNNDQARHIFVFDYHNKYDVYFIELVIVRRDWPSIQFLMHRSDEPRVEAVMPNTVISLNMLPEMVDQACDIIRADYHERGGLNG